MYIKSLLSYVCVCVYIYIYIYIYIYKALPVVYKIPFKLHMCVYIYTYIYKALPILYKTPCKLQPEDGVMKAETCSCYVLLINYILCNNVVLHYIFVQSTSYSKQQECLTCNICPVLAAHCTVTVLRNVGGFLTASS